MKQRTVFSRFARLILGGVLPALVAGCTSFDYVGRSFAPRPESARVAIFRDRSAMAEGKYTMMGRGVLTAPESYDRYDVEERLGELAREHGADAVLIVKTRTVFRSFNVPEGRSGFASPSAISVNPTNSAPDGRPLEENSFGRQVDPPDTYGGATVLRPDAHHYGRKLSEISVIFYRKAEEMRELMRAREKKIGDAASRSASDYHPLTLPEPAPQPVKDASLPEVP